MNIVHNKFELHLSNLGIKYTQTFMSFKFMYRKVSNIRHTKSQNLNAPTTSEWSTIYLPTEVRLILETWRYVLEEWVIYRGAVDGLAPTTGD